MQGTFIMLAQLLNKCLLHKLSKEYYENDFHVEYQLRSNALQENFENLESLLQNADFIENSDASSTTLCYLLFLYLELKAEAPWNTEQIKDMKYSAKLNEIFKNKHSINLEDVLQNNLFDSQLVFDKCIQELHKKMTANDFKYYPSLIEVYCLLVKNIKNYNININPVTVLPVCLLLIDDFITNNKIKGLQSCTAVLQSLAIEDFTAGNYYEVIYSSLEKNIVEKDRGVTQALFLCFIEFLKVVPSDIKKTKLDDIFSNVADQVHIESNLYRKADCFDFLTKVIEMHGVNCAKKTDFKDVIRDNIDICSHESVSEILLLRVLECFQMWLRYCWCIWKLPADHKMLSSLFKILYLSQEETTQLKLQNLIVTLVKLCDKDEQMNILDNLDNPLKCSNNDFLNRLDIIKKQIKSLLQFNFTSKNIFPTFLYHTSLTCTYLYL